MKRSELFFVLIVVSSSWPSHGFALDEQTADSSIRQLTKMSAVEREQFNRNLTAFQQMSPEQKAQYRKLHNDLIVERKESGAGLQALMETYSVWLMTLSPAQRDELQQESDFAKRIAIVRRFKEEQERSFEHQEMPHEESLAQSTPKSLAKWAMDKKDLDAISRAIVDYLPFDRKKAEFEEVGLNNYLPILQESIQQYGNPHEWPGDQLIVKMQAAVRKETSKELQRSSSKREMLIRMTLMGILKLANDQVHEPTAEERIQIALALPPEERAKIIKLPPQQMKWAIRKKYYDTKGDEARKQMNQLLMYRRQVIDLFDQLGVELPPILKRPDRAPRGKG